jgi:anti-sigma B factor antagonist
MCLDYLDWDVGDVAVITLIGRITLGKGTELLRQVVGEVMERGRVKLLLNFDEVLYMDSSGLGELVAAHRRVLDAGGQLKLMKLQKVARNLIQITQLYTVFEIFKDEASALASFRRPARN